MRSNPQFINAALIILREVLRNEKKYSALIIKNTISRVQLDAKNVTDIFQPSLGRVLYQESLYCQEMQLNHYFDKQTLLPLALEKLHAELTADFTDFIEEQKTIKTATLIRTEFKKHAFDDIREHLPNKILTTNQYLQDHEAKQLEIKGYDDFIKKSIEAYQLEPELKSFFKDIFSGAAEKFYPSHQIEELSQAARFKLCALLKNYINTETSKTKDKLTSEIGQSFCLLTDNLPNLFKDTPIEKVRISLEQICHWFFMLIEFSQKIFNAQLKPQTKEQLLATLKDFRHPTLATEEKTLWAFSIQSISAISEYLPDYFQSFQKPPKDKLKLKRDSAELITKATSILFYKKSRDTLSLELKLLEEKQKDLEAKIKAHSNLLSMISNIALAPSEIDDQDIKKLGLEKSDYQKPDPEKAALPLLKVKANLQDQLFEVNSKIKNLKSGLDSLEKKCTFS